MATANRVPLKFKEFAPHIDVSFWMEVERRKLHEWKLDERPVPIVLWYPSPITRMKHHIANIVTVSGDSFDTAMQRNHMTRIQGTLQVLNTSEQLVQLDKKDALRKEGEKSIQKMRSGTWDSECFTPVSIIAYADLKAHKFSYIVAFPAVDVEGTKPTICREPASARFSESQLQMIWNHALKAHDADQIPFVVKAGKDAAAEFLPFAPSTPNLDAEDHFVVFCDPSTMEEYPGWPLRNILAAIQLTSPSVSRVRFLALRDSPSNSVVFDSAMSPGTPAAREVENVRVAGWAETRIRTIELGSMMDPAQLSASSAKLNLSLMKWRMMPELKLDGLTSCRALILGSGTLGCNISRHLLMWGVTSITLVDRGNVSYSNPVRQSLFELSDVLADGDEKVKSIAAAKTLKRILPSANVRGVKLTIHMPGHRIDEATRQSAEKEVKQLEELILAHDVTFLLTDSRESRWLPTMLCAAFSKPLINAAIGFDTYVVMRHGVPIQGAGDRLGCYFCNDVVAPIDSLSARSLDQQCTVTRPGVSAIASALAVELLAALYNHPLTFSAPAYREDDADEGESSSSTLGIVPHQIRGGVADYAMTTLHGQCYPKCTACSPIVTQAYLKEGFPFLAKCINDPSYIEEITGLKQEKEQLAAMSTDWDIDDD